MIRATFKENGDNIKSFHISGHALCGPAGEDIVCAAVSSAVYMAANTVLEVLNLPADVSVSEGSFSFELQNGSDQANAVLAGLKLHLFALAEQYADCIEILIERC